MKIKQFISLTFIGLIILTVFTGCKKYPDGPGLSLRSKTERVSNTWKVENYKINGSDFTSLVSNYTETFTKEGNYSYSWGILSGNSGWAFQNKNMEIKLNGNDYNTSRTLFILKLEEKNFWYYFIDDKNKYEIHLIEQ